jgi:membrane fusion protein, multidrug efflux system
MLMERIQDHGLEGGLAAADKTDAALGREEPERRREASRKRRVRRFLLVAAATAACLIGAGGIRWWLQTRGYESTDDAFIDARQFAVSAKVSGYIVDVPVHDNQLVEAGAPLAHIDDRDYRTALEQAEAQLAQAKAGVANVVAQIAAQQAQIAQAEAQYAQAAAALSFAQEDSQRYQFLARRGAGSLQQAQHSDSDLQQKQAALDAAKWAIAASRAQLEVVQAQKASAEANVATAKAACGQAALNLSYTTITAAQRGRVAHLSAARGQFVQPGQALMMFVPDRIWVTANFKETQITDMHPGQPVTVTIDAYPDRKVEGHLDSIQPGSGTAFSLLPAENATGNYVKVTQRVPVKIVLDHVPADIALGPGMSVEPEVKVR